MIGRGIYSFSEASRLCGLSTARIRAWFNRPSVRAGGRSLFRSDYEAIDDRLAISFHDLVDVFIAGQLVDQGVPIQTVRRVYTNLQQLFAERHAFCRKELLTDGKKVFYKVVDDEGREHLVDILERQHVFPKVILPFLKALEYENRLASRWRIADGIVVDPAISFGKPSLSQSRIASYVLAEAYEANDRNVDLVAAWYEVPEAEVCRAVDFEHSLAA